MTARKYDPVCSYPGCGRSHNARGLCGPHGLMQRQGKELRPILGRTGPIERSELDRFADKIALADSGCVEWIGGKNLGGYGMFGPKAGADGPKKLMAHRWSYEHHVGPIPDDLQIDHLCRNRACVNPDHLEPVTAAENVRRATREITHCPSNHPYDEANTLVTHQGHRRCRACVALRDAARRGTKNAKRREKRRLAQLTEVAA